ncbi:MAG: holo-ACP synthase [Nitrospirota bacterium]
MIYGIGIDMVRVRRIQGAVEKWGERFLQRIFTGDEIAYCYARKNPYLPLSARFAAKEAFIKAAGSRIGVTFSDIEVTNNDAGQPFLRLKGTLQEFLRKNSIAKVHLSLSHEQEYAVACVVLERHS